MADPVTATFIALAVLAGGGQIAGGIASKKAADAEAKSLKRMGQAAAADRRREAKSVLGAQKAAFGKAGVTAAGTSTDVRLATAAELELRALRERFGFRQEAARVKEQGRQALIAGILGAGQTILGAGFQGQQAGILKLPKGSTSSSSTGRTAHGGPFG